MFPFFAASKSIFPNPTAKFDNIFTLGDNLLIVSDQLICKRRKNTIAIFAHFN